LAHKSYQLKVPLELPENIMVNYVRW